MTQRILLNRKNEVMNHNFRFNRNENNTCKLKCLVISNSVIRNISELQVTIITYYQFTSRSQVTAQKRKHSLTLGYRIQLESETTSVALSLMRNLSKADGLCFCVAKFNMMEETKMKTFNKHLGKWKCKRTNERMRK